MIVRFYTKAGHPSTGGGKNLLLSAKNGISGKIGIDYVATCRTIILGSLLKRQQYYGILYTSQLLPANALRG
jgi:hypothetical protein